MLNDWNDVGIDPGFRANAMTQPPSILEMQIYRRKIVF
jgi:hypothetical protein